MSPASLQLAAWRLHLGLWFGTAVFFVAVDGVLGLGFQWTTVGNITVGYLFGMWMWYGLGLLLRWARSRG